jgi:hypothetical protein
VGGGGKLWRSKLAILAGILNIESLDEFANQYGDRWAYQLRPALALIELPYYEDMKLARMNGWDLVNEQGEEWPFHDLTPPQDYVRKQNLQAFGLAKEILLHHQGFRPREEVRRFVPYEAKSADERLRPAIKSWLDYSVGNN